MRIVGGIKKGRKLVSFKSPGIRPTSDKVREAIFNVLGCHEYLAGEEMPFKKALDLFAGTGAMGIEALSRGVERVTFVDSDKAAAAIIIKNLEICGFKENAAILKMDVKKALLYFKGKEERFDLIFIDAPYIDISLTNDALRNIPFILNAGGYCVCEASKKNSPSVSFNGLTLEKEKRYGDTVVYFLKPQNPI